MRQVSVRSLSEMADLVRSSDRLAVCEQPSTRIGGYGLDWEDSAVWMADDRPVDMNIVPEDFYVEVSANCPIALLQEELGRRGLWLPLEPLPLSPFEWGSVRDGLAWNYPLPESHRRGSWKDWILGIEALTAEGEVVKFGSKVTKSVAGFDGHKFLVGSRNAFMIPTTVTLRVFPEQQLERAKPLQEHRFTTWWAQRCLPADWNVMLGALNQEPVATCKESFTIWMVSGPPSQRYSGDWALSVGEQGQPPEFTAAEAWVLRRAKRQFDPSNKFNAGVLGVI